MTCRLSACCMCCVCECVCSVFKTRFVCVCVPLHSNETPVVLVRVGKESVLQKHKKEINAEMMQKGCVICSMPKSAVKTKTVNVLEEKTKKQPPSRS